jgi:hypothetical protein
MSVTFSKITIDETFLLSAKIEKTFGTSVDGHKQIII